MKKLVCVLITSGYLKGHKFLARANCPILLGETEDSTIKFACDSFCPKKYAVVFCEKDTCFIEDLDSTGRTFINDTRIYGKKELKDRDIISFGDNKMIVLIRDDTLCEIRETLKLETLEMYNEFGIACFEKGLFNDAIHGYKEAIRIKPDSAEGHYNLGLVFGNKGLLDDAIKELRESIRLKPDFAEAHCNLGVAFAKKGLLDRSIKEFEEAVRLKPDFIEARNNLESTLKDKNLLDSIIEDLKEVDNLGQLCWDITCLNITRGLEVVRKAFFDRCIKILKEKNVNIINDNLGGNGNMAIKAFQLFITPYFIEEHNYVPSSGIENFLEILYKYVCGTQINKCLLFSRYYNEARSHVTTQWIRFTIDIVEHISGNKHPLLAVFISPILPIFIVQNQIVIATCFRDEKTVKDLLSKAGKLNMA